VTFGAGTTFAVELGGLAVGVQYDQLSATNTVNLGGATLNVALINAFSPAIGDSFTIIQSTGAITGQFAQGTSISAGNVQFSIAYNANSVVLTVTSLGPTFTLSVTLPGSGSGTVTSPDTFINCPGLCSHAYPSGTPVTLTAAPAAGSQFTGWLGACTGTGQCVLTMDAAKSVSATFASNTVVTNDHILDVDANGQYDAATDALLITRYMFGLTGASLTDNAIGGGMPQRSTSGAIATYLNDVLPLLDIDANGQADALTDGVLIIRALLGQTGTALTENAIGPGATRTVPMNVQGYIQSLKP
jgi:hypothetical protein